MENCVNSIYLSVWVFKDISHEVNLGLSCWTMVWQKSWQLSPAVSWLWAFPPCPGDSLQVCFGWHPVSVLEGLTCDTHFIAWEINFSILMLGLGRLGRCRHSGKWHLCPVLPFPLSVAPCRVGAQKCCFPLSEMQLFKGHQRELVVCKLAVLSCTQWSVEGEVACALCEHWRNAGALECGQF